MPKKHASSYQNAKPQSVPHPSLSSTTGVVPPPSTPNTVNSLLYRLRHSQRSAGLTTSSEATSSRHKGTAHPSIRSHSTYMNRQRTAGPPPPKSWIENVLRPGLGLSRHAISDPPKDNSLPGLPDEPRSEPRSLQRMVLKSMARNLDWHIEIDGEWMPSLLPGRLKSELIALVMNLPQGRERLGERELQTLFAPYQDEDNTWISGGDGVTHLVIGPAVGFTISWPELGTLLQRDAPFVGHKSGGEVPDNWDASSSESSVSLSPNNEESLYVPKTLRVPFLPHLTHLSLSRSPNPSWRALLSPKVLPHLAHLTHLDLAYWPAPAMTPNAIVTQVRGPVYDVPYSATGPYSQMDGDFSEAVNVLKRLGRGCRGLKWLGLEGCVNWFPALGFERNTTGSRRNRLWQDDEIRENQKSGKVIGGGMDWNGVWRGLVTIRVSQGFSITDTGIVKDDDLLNWETFLRLARRNLGVERWIRNEVSVRNVERKVAKWRLDGGLQAVKFEKTPIPDSVEILLWERLMHGEVE
jgi:hypothetical protein